MDNIVSVYFKDNKIKLIGFFDPQLVKAKMIEEGWKHTATINTCEWIENLFNEGGKEDLDLWDDVKALSNNLKN